MLYMEVKSVTKDMIKIKNAENPPMANDIEKREDRVEGI